MKIDTDGTVYNYPTSCKHRISGSCGMFCDEVVCTNMNVFPRYCPLKEVE